MPRIALMQPEPVRPKRHREPARQCVSMRPHTNPTSPAVETGKDSLFEVCRIHRWGCVNVNVLNKVATCRRFVGPTCKAPGCEPHSN